MILLDEGIQHRSQVGFELDANSSGCRINISDPMTQTSDSAMMTAVTMRPY